MLTVAFIGNLKNGGLVQASVSGAGHAQPKIALTQEVCLSNGKKMTAELEEQRKT
jgi:hypothetical protein